jgi:hypothetical protein
LPEDTVAINCAVEVTTVGERIQNGLLPQDAFLRDRLSTNDVLIVSVGGNEFALKPTNWTRFHMLAVIAAPACTLRYNPSFWALVRIFRDQVTAYVAQLTVRCTVAERKRLRVLVCMIYYPCTVYNPLSWSGALLKLTGYDRNPVHVQHLIRMLYEYGTRCIPDVTPVPLFDVLDADNSTHYVARVEPSSEGGRLMAERFCALL